MFLTKSELRALTGRATKSKQVEQLRRMGVPFYLNAAGHPIVTRAAVEGSKEPPVTAKPWSPKVRGSKA